MASGGTLDLVFKRLGGALMSSADTSSLDSSFFLVGSKSGTGFLSVSALGAAKREVFTASFVSDVAGVNKDADSGALARGAPKSEVYSGACPGLPNRLGFSVSSSVGLGTTAGGFKKEEASLSLELPAVLTSLDYAATGNLTSALAGTGAVTSY